MTMELTSVVIHLDIIGQWNNKGLEMVPTLMRRVSLEI